MGNKINVKPVKAVRYDLKDEFSLKPTFYKLESYVTLITYPNPS